MSNIDDVVSRISECEKTNRQLKAIVKLQTTVLVLVVCVMAGASSWASRTSSSAVYDSVRAREVVIMDGKTVRARLGGTLPDAEFDGKKHSRGSHAAGLLIYDEEGIERGGYVTQDTGSNAMLTLDSKHGQSALFVAGPDLDRVSALRLWNSTSSIEIRADDIGARVSVSEENEVTLQLPETKQLDPSSCSRYKSLQKQFPNESICRERFTQTTCNACLKD